MHRLVPPLVQELADRETYRDTTSGAALIVDAEGSTALSARLQPHGTAGAEAFADILATLFRPMVERASAAGASVTDLPGDGVLAIFPGDPTTAVANAVSAAAGIMNDLESVAEFDTPDGPASLTVRSAIGAGSIDWVLWTSGDADARQNAAYASLGSAADEARRGEEITPGGMISVGPNAARFLGEDIPSSDLTEGFLGISPALDDKASKAEPLVSEPPSGQLRFYPRSLLEEGLRGEFRDVVAVFVEFSGQAADRYMSRALHAITRYHGYLNNVARPSHSIEGIRSFALWGAPTSHEHDVGYALRFVEDLRSEFGSEVRAGVTRSTAYAGLIGGRDREVYTAIGPGVNLAARMCDSAGWGEIWTNQDVTARLTDPWRFEDLDQVSYRGFAIPIPTARVTYVPPVRVADAFHGSIVGRDLELDTLEDLFAPLWSGRGTGVIAVTGDPGVGKSRLITALEERLSKKAPAPAWMHAQADEISTQPLATLRDALTSYFGRPGRAQSGERLDAYLHEVSQGTPDRANELARTRSALGDLLQLAPDVSKGEKLDPRTRFENLVIAVENLVEAVERRSPVILAVADAHWMDGGTADVLGRVAADLATKRVAILLETRDPRLGLEYDHLVEVGPLDDSGVAALATQLLGGAPPIGLVQSLAERSGGNPFFAQQLLELSRQQDAVGDDAGVLTGLSADPNVPVDMRRVLVARLDNLPPEVRRIVQTASILGREIDLEILQKVNGESSNIGQQVRGAIEGGIWERVDDNHVGFTNLLIRDAAYGMLLHSDARALHRQAASAIESTAFAENRSAELAYHHDQAGNSSVAARLYLTAGRQAAERYDNRQAVAYADRALDLLSAGNRALRFETLRLKHDVFAVEGDRSSQEVVITLMEHLTQGDAQRSIDVVVLRATLLSALGRYQDAEQLLDASAELGDDPAHLSARGQLAFLRAQLARYQGHSDEAVRHANDASDMFEQSGEDLLLAQVNDFSGGLAWESGEFESAADLHESAADRFRKAGRVTQEIGALNNLGTAIFSMGDYARARVIHQEGADRSRDIGYRMGEGDHLDNMGGTAWAVGDLALALQYYSEALRIREGMNDAWGVAISKGNLGSTQRAMGNPDLALDLYRQALQIDQRIGRRRGEAYDLHGIGLCHLDLARYNLASESLRRSAAIREELGERHLANESHVACALAMQRGGDPTGATELVETVLADEGDEFFSGAVETTASRLRAVEVLEHGSPELAHSLKERTKEGVLERAKRISDPEQRRTYLEEVESHSKATADS